MAITGLGAYNDALYQWKNQQLKNTGNSAANSNSTAINTLFGGATSMTSQISSMVELTRYAMDQMGLASDSRVTFSQITRYREQLQSEFDAAVKAGIEKSGIIDITALSYELDRNGKITVTGGSAECRKAAQAWVDANASYGQTLLEALPHDIGDEDMPVEFTISSTGKISVVHHDQATLQKILDDNKDLANNARKGLEEAGIQVKMPVDLKFDEDGNLYAEGDSEEIKALNAWLKENTEIADTVKKAMDKQKIHTSAATLRLGESGPLRITVNDATLNDIQKGLDTATDTGGRLIQGLQNLGIDKNINFAIKVNDDGTITVISDHKDRDKMQKFFDENPDLVKKYRQIETLAGIDDAREAMQISPAAMRKRIQIESMAAWWAGSADYSSYFGNYSTEGLSLLAGLNKSV